LSLSENKSNHPKEEKEKEKEGTSNFSNWNHR